MRWNAMGSPLFETLNPHASHGMRMCYSDVTVDLEARRLGWNVTFPGNTGYPK